MKIGALITTVIFGLFGLLLVPQAGAQTVVDQITVTAGSGGRGYEGFKSQQSGTATGGGAGPYGSVSPAVDSSGYAIYGLWSNDGQTCPHSDCLPSLITYQLGGLTTDPGQSYLSALNVVSGAVGPYPLVGANATYTYSGGIATWTWDLPGYAPDFSGGVGSTGTFTVTHGAPPEAFLDLRYQILGVDYAPPGAKSNVNYGSSAMRGTATTDAGTFKSTQSTSVTTQYSFGISAIFKGSISSTISNSYSQQTGTNSSITVATTTSNSDIVYGPASSSAGVDHDYDVIWVWLNPMAVLYDGLNTLTFAGYGFNGADDADEMEVVPLYVAWLKNPSSMPANVAARLARTWDTSGLRGLGSADYATILGADPLVSASYNPSNDTVHHRFDLIEGSTLPYEPAASGSQPLTQTGSIATQTSSSQGQSAQTTYSVGVSVSGSATLSPSAMTSITSSFQTSDSWETTDSWSSTVNSQTGKTASYSITGPASTDGYYGPTEFQVWRDNIYGSFMFFPVGGQQGPLIGNLTVSNSTANGGYGSSYQVCPGSSVCTTSNGFGPNALQYVDRSYVIDGSVPSLVNGGTYILTANSDKNAGAGSANYMTFTLGEAATVYVAYNTSNLAKPTWLTSNFTDTGLSITDSDAGKFELYSKAYASGSKVVLGGNSVVGGYTGMSMYSVIVVP